MEKEFGGQTIAVVHDRASDVPCVEHEEFLHEVVRKLVEL
jgi:hypothetical protein